MLPMDQPVRIDLHCHSSASYDGRVDPVRLVELARDRGLTHVAITDHETIDGALAAQKAAIEGITVIVGEEVRTTEGDLILLHVKEPVPRGLSPEETAMLARAQGCLIGLPHPFDPYRPSIAVGTERHEELERLAGLADYVEVHNGRVTDQHAGARAADFARRYSLPQVAVSDCHRETEVASAYCELTTIPGSTQELLAGLAAGSLRVLERTEPEPDNSLRRFLARLRP
jgi:predicted metal-dependent phosphoesterase TrpH